MGIVLDVFFQKRVVVFPNGESIERAQYVWGESLEQLLDNSNTRLDLKKPARYIFTLEGIHVSIATSSPSKAFTLVLPRHHHPRRHSR